MNYTYRPIIIVGAGRSGTKLLRGILNAGSDTTSFPREINYIWRHGNALLPTDELKPEHAKPHIKQYIQNRFASLSKHNGNKRVIEKTCANSLRVEFVTAIFPEAYIIHVIRDGRAVAESASRLWQGKPEIRYLLEKARWLPVSDIPYYALRYLHYQLGRLSTESRSQSSWGPRFAGLDQLISEKKLIEVCGIQWRVCVESAEIAMKQLSNEQCMTVRYEDIVSNPVEITRQLFDQLHLTFNAQIIEHLQNTITTQNLMKWRADLTEEALILLMPHIESTLLEYGYQV